MAENGFKKNKICRLEEMHATNTNFSYIAIIIGKCLPNVFLDRHTKQQRGVITFTLRDSVQSIANCKCWGPKDFVEEYNANLQIGDVVDVAGGKVLQIALTNYPGNTNQRYQPRGTIPFALCINAGQGSVVKHAGNDLAAVQPLRNLMHHSHKPLSSVNRLADVFKEKPGCSLPPFVDLYVAVGAVFPKPVYKRSFNGPQRCLGVQIFDQSWPEGKLLTIWQKDWIDRAQYWQPGKTLVHLIDVRVIKATSSNGPELTHGNSTLIFENPQPLSKESLTLLEIASPKLLKDIHKFDPLEKENFPPAHQIENHMSVRQIYARVEGALKKETPNEFTALVYVILTKLDLDGMGVIIGKKCLVCQRLILNNQDSCTNKYCFLKSSTIPSGLRIQNCFNTNIHLTDQTGTLVETRLSDEVAERLLKIKADAFLLLPEEKKISMKWRFLFKPFMVKLAIRKPSETYNTPSIIVLDIQPIGMDIFNEKSIVY